ncbi:acid protease [Trametes gibbosa]|nr:acid protease [Trametes gibbosa]
MFPLSFVPLVGGILPFFVCPTTVASKPSSFSVSVRGNGVAFLDGPLSADNVGVFTSNNNLYSTDINLGGINLTVNLDTGSSDLVILRPGLSFAFTNTTDLQTNETFGKGEAIGNINFANLRIGDFELPQQAFFDAAQTKDLDNSGDGILGISFNAPSAVLGTLAQAVGNDIALQIGSTPLPALFSQQPDLPDSFDVALTRADELGDVSEGTFLIGEHDDNFQDVTDAPQLTSVSPDHWSVVLDSMKVNGQAFQFDPSRIQNVPSGKVAAVLDTGFSFPPLPPAAVDAIYSSISGAVFDKDQGIWIVPCNETTQLSFVFAGNEFLVHPLDLTAAAAGPFNTADPSTNVTVCINRFQYLTLDPNEFVGFDLILGDAFLRNAYISFNYGDENIPPFVQMIPTTTDFNQALQEFQTQRAATLAKLPPTADPASIANKEGQQAPANGSNGPSSPTTGSSGQPDATQTSESTTGTAQPTTTSQNANPTNTGNGAGRDTVMNVGSLSVTALLCAGILL